MLFKVFFNQILSDHCDEKKREAVLTLEANNVRIRADAILFSVLELSTLSVMPTAPSRTMNRY